MKWFQGSVDEAVSTCVARSAIFIVYVEGTDELSRSMNSALNDAKISKELESESFVSIKLQKDSESHKQFTEIYKIVPVPSLFFIRNGVPLEIVAGDNSSQTVVRKISAAISKAKGEPVSADGASTSQSCSSPEQTLKQPENEASSSQTEPNEEKVSSVSNISSEPSVLASSSGVKLETSSSHLEDPVVPTPPETVPVNKPLNKEQLTEYMQKKKIENKKVEEEKEKERELSRRKMGQEMAMAKRKQQEKELEELVKEREREKREEAAARERVLRQIREDQEARAARFAQPAAALPQQATGPTQPPLTSGAGKDSARIQFKLPDGQTRTNTFSAEATIQEIRQFIDSNISVPFKEYTLVTTYPKREFTFRDLNRTLRSLELTPSSVILIMPLQGGVMVSRGPGWTTTFMTMLWDMVQPLFAVGRYLRSLVFGGAEPADTPPPPQPAGPEPPSDPQPSRPTVNFGGSRTVRKRGNIHSLTDGNDSNDENNTWNGNSTQLM